MGRIYGEVDFGIISASVEIIALAMIQFVLETYQPIPILLTAKVSVKASVKVAFVRIKFSFKMTVKQKFVASLKRRIRPMVDSDDQVDQEIRDLMGILSGPRPYNG